MLCLIRKAEKSPLVESHVRGHFPLFSQIKWICTEGLFPTQENDVLKQIQAFFSTTGLPASSHPDSHPPTIDTAIFVKSHLKKRLFSLPTSKWPSTSSTRQEFWNFWIFWTFWAFKVVGWRPAPGIAECISRLDCWEFLKLHQWQITSNWVLNIPRLERWSSCVFSVPVYYLLEHSLSRFQMWTFHFALHATFSSGFWYGMHVRACLWNFRNVCTCLFISRNEIYYCGILQWPWPCPWQIHEPCI